MVQFDNRPYSPPTLESLLKRYGTGKRRQKMESAYTAMLAEATRLASVTNIYDEFDVSAVEPLHEWLAPDTTSVILALCTLGPQLDEAIQTRTQDDLLAAVLLKEIGAAWIVIITRELHKSLRNLTQQRGLKAGPAYRPGVGRWPLETQRTVFAKLPAELIGVSLDEYLFMRPVLSTSLIIPVLDRNR